MLPRLVLLLSSLRAPCGVRAAGLAAAWGSWLAPEWAAEAATALPLARATPAALKVLLQAFALAWGLLA